MYKYIIIIFRICCPFCTDTFFISGINFLFRTFFAAFLSVFITAQKRGTTIMEKSTGGLFAALKEIGVHGPKNIIMVVGMNKLVSDVETGCLRVQNTASPANAKRLNRNTPCFHTGRCGDCLSDDCMCNHIVITRRSGIPGRIKIFFIAEELGY